MPEYPQPKDEHWQPPSPIPQYQLPPMKRPGTLLKHQPRKYSMGEILIIVCIAIVVLGGCLLMFTGIISTITR